jgi:hypothetical protein
VWYIIEYCSIGNVQIQSGKLANDTEFFDAICEIFIIHKNISKVKDCNDLCTSDSVLDLGSMGPAF